MRPQDQWIVRYQPRESSLPKPIDEMNADELRFFLKDFVRTRQVRAAEVPASQLRNSLQHGHRRSRSPWVVGSDLHGW